MFNNLDFTNVKHVLELDCGNGILWSKNLKKIPEDISITLLDISAGMVDSVRKALGGNGKRFQFGVVGACQTTFKDAAFQMILAVHMLYNIDDNKRIFMEIERLLSDTGFAYTSTLSMKNLQELMGLAIEPLLPRKNVRSNSRLKTTHKTAGLKRNECKHFNPRQVLTMLIK